MNRREAMAAIAAMPMVGTVKVIDPEPMPLFAVIEFEQRVSCEARKLLIEEWHKAFVGKPPFPILILQDGAKIKFCSREAAEAEASNA